MGRKADVRITDAISISYDGKWRRRRDSNPRYGF
jgi:hypothetical protein